MPHYCRVESGLVKEMIIASDSVIASGRLGSGWIRASEGSVKLLQDRELSVYSQVWDNFKTYMFSEIYPDVDAVSLNKINIALEPWRGEISSLADHRIVFETEADLAFFLLKWS